MKYLIAYLLCPLLGGILIRWKQGVPLDPLQKIAFVIGGPFTLLIALLPRSYFVRHDWLE